MQMETKKIKQKHYRVETVIIPVHNYRYLAEIFFGQLKIPKIRPVGDSSSKSRIKIIIKYHGRTIWARWGMHPQPLPSGGDLGRTGGMVPLKRWGTKVLISPPIFIMYKCYIILLYHYFVFGAPPCTVMFGKCLCRTWTHVQSYTARTTFK